MNYHLISSLARMRSEELIAAAERRRALRARAGAAVLRLRVGRAVRRVGTATVRFGDALAGTR